jgi:toxin ParE1/3/4
MDLKIVWTDSAIVQLETIFDFYKTTASLNVARKISTDLVRKTKLLPNQPNTGQQEVLLKSRKNEYRYLVEGNYKIIYWVENEMIIIGAIFDTRQDPEKLKNIKM